MPKKSSDPIGHSTAFTALRAVHTLTSGATSLVAAPAYEYIPLSGIGRYIDRNAASDGDEALRKQAERNGIAIEKLANVKQLEQQISKLANNSRPSWDTHQLAVIRKEWDKAQKEIEEYNRYHHPIAVASDPVEESRRGIARMAVNREVRLGVVSDSQTVASTAIRIMKDAHYHATLVNTMGSVIAPVSSAVGAISGLASMAQGIAEIRTGAKQQKQVKDYEKRVRAARLACPRLALVAACLPLFSSAINAALHTAQTTRAGGVVRTLYGAATATLSATAVTLLLTAPAAIAPLIVSGTLAACATLYLAIAAARQYIARKHTRAMAKDALAFQAGCHLSASTGPTRLQHEEDVGLPEIDFSSTCEIKRSDKRFTLHRQIFDAVQQDTRGHADAFLKAMGLDNGQIEGIRNGTLDPSALVQKLTQPPPDRYTEEHSDAASKTQKAFTRVYAIYAITRIDNQAMRAALDARIDDEAMQAALDENAVVGHIPRMPLPSRPPQAGEQNDALAPDVNIAPLSLPVSPPAMGDTAGTLPQADGAHELPRGHRTPPRLSDYPKSFLQKEKKLQNKTEPWCNDFSTDDFERWLESDAVQTYHRNVAAAFFQSDYALFAQRNGFHRISFNLERLKQHRGLSLEKIFADPKQSADLYAHFNAWTARCKASDLALTRIVSRCDLKDFEQNLADPVFERLVAERAPQSYNRSTLRSFDILNEIAGQKISHKNIDFFLAAENSMPASADREPWREDVETQVARLLNANGLDAPMGTPLREKLQTLRTFYGFAHYLSDQRPEKVVMTLCDHPTQKISDEQRIVLRKAAEREWAFRISTAPEADDPLSPIEQIQLAGYIGRIAPLTGRGILRQGESGGLGGTFGHKLNDAGQKILSLLSGQRADPRLFFPSDVIKKTLRHPVFGLLMEKLLKARGHSINAQSTLSEIDRQLALYHRPAAFRKNRPLGFDESANRKPLGGKEEHAITDLPENVEDYYTVMGYLPDYEHLPVQAREVISRNRWNFYECALTAVSSAQKKKNFEAITQELTRVSTGTRSLAYANDAWSATFLARKLDDRALEKERHDILQKYGFSARDISGIKRSAIKEARDIPASAFSEIFSSAAKSRKWLYRHFINAGVALGEDELSEIVLESRRAISLVAGRPQKEKLLSGWLYDVTEYWISRQLQHSLGMKPAASH